MVCNGASNFRGMSINACLLRNPDHTNTLAGVLLRFRKDSIALMGYIKAMVFQVRMSEKDKDSWRSHCWRDGVPNAEICEYRMTTFILDHGPLQAYELAAAEHEVI